MPSLTPRRTSTGSLGLARRQIVMNGSAAGLPAGGWRVLPDDAEGDAQIAARRDDHIVRRPRQGATGGRRARHRHSADRLGADDEFGSVGGPTLTASAAAVLGKRRSQPDLLRVVENARSAWSRLALSRAMAAASVDGATRRAGSSRRQQLADSAPLRRRARACRPRHASRRASSPNRRRISPARVSLSARCRVM